MCTQVYAYLLIFLKEFLQRDIEDISILIMFLLIVSLGYRSFSQYNRMRTFIFPTEFLKDYT
jgi:hypothetical protein